MAIGTKLKISFDGNEVKRGLAGMKSELKSAAKAAGVAGAAIAAIGAGLVLAAKKAVDFGLAINKMGEAANTANTKVRIMLRNTGLFGDETERVTKRLTDMADAMARRTGIDAKSIKSAMSQALAHKELAATAGDADGMFDRLITTATNMSALFGGDVTSNMRKISNAMVNPQRGMNALQREGANLNAELREQIKVLIETGQTAKAQELLFNGLEKAMDGVAEETANASERIGQGITQIKESFAAGFSAAFQDLPDGLEGAITDMIEKVAPLGRAFGQIIREALDGDIENLAATAFMVGTVLGESLKAGFMASLRKLGVWALDQVLLYNPGDGVRLFEAGRSGNMDFNIPLDDRFDRANRALMQDDMRNIIDNARVEFARILHGIEKNTREGAKF